ncbi:MAG: acyl-CoA thioesterase [Acidimicrobiales bacterium]
MSNDQAAGSVATILAALELESLAPMRWRTPTPRGEGRLFGGQVAAQSLKAACLSVEPGRRPNSLHAYFVRAGRPGVGIDLDVRLIRDGRSFSTRQVTASQDDVPIFEMLASFHVEETGRDWQLPAPQGMPQPEDLAGLDWGRFHLGGVDIRLVGAERRFSGFPILHPCWIRLRAPLEDDPVTHASIMAYLSDIALMGSAAAPGSRFQVPGSASLDHAVWFHRDARADDWLLYSAEPTTNFGARGLARGTFHTRGGELVASVMQEALIRPVV